MGFLGGAWVVGREPGWSGPAGGHWDHILVTVRLLLLGSMGDERLATAARGKWPNVNSSFWRWGWGTAVITAAHEKMNRDLKKGRKKSRWGGGGKRGHEGRSEGLGQGARFQPSPLIFIYHILAGKELFGEQAWGMECSSHHSCTLKPNISCYILHPRGPWQINSDATESQSADNEVSGNSFSYYNGLA